MLSESLQQVAVSHNVSNEVEMIVCSYPSLETNSLYIIIIKFILRTQKIY